MERPLRTDASQYTKIQSRICNSKQANQHEMALICADIRGQAQLPLCVFADIVVVTRA